MPAETMTKTESVGSHFGQVASLPSISKISAASPIRR